MSLRFYIYCKNTGQDQILISCYKAIFVTVNTVKAIFSSSHVQLWELDHKESWALKNWYFQTKVLEKILESASDSKDIKPVNPKGNQPWIFIGRTDAEAPILWPPVVKSWLTGKDLDAGKDWGQEEKGTTEYEMAGWHLTQWTWGLSKIWETVKDREAWHAAVDGTAKSWTWLSDWITRTKHSYLKSKKHF